MKDNQIQQIFTDLNDTDYAFGKWIHPTKISYIVLKDNSILRTDKNLMFFFHKTDQLLYVASGIWNEVNQVSIMPRSDTAHQENVDRMVSIIAFENINNVSLNYKGEYFGGKQVWRT